MADDKKNIMYEIDSRDEKEYSFAFSRASKIPPFQIKKGYQWLTQAQYEALKQKTIYGVMTKLFETSKIKNVGWSVKEVVTKKAIPQIESVKQDEAQVKLVLSLGDKSEIEKAIEPQKVEDGIQRVDVLKALANKEESSEQLERDVAVAAKKKIAKIYEKNNK